MRPQRLRLVWAAAAIAVGAIALSIFLGRNPSAAVLTSIEGSLERVEGLASVRVRPNERMRFDELVRSLANSSAVLTLNDGSQLELRPNSALALEKAEDGVRIRLDSGGVLVDAAKQHSGHLYVKTKDLSVSVVGTVFLVNAEEAGSRVAVIQGEVQVTQGQARKVLRPGDQVSSNPLMPTHSVVEQIAWSRRTAAHAEQLRQTTTPNRQFEVASLRLGDSSPGVFRSRIRCRGIDGELLPSRKDAPAVPLGRCVGTNVPEGLLIAAAFDMDMRRIAGLSGPATQLVYQVDAKSADVTKSTKEDLREMLRQLLIDRLNLKFHRETSEADGFVLAVSSRGLKIKETSNEEEPVQLRNIAPPGTLQRVPMLAKGNFSLRRLADALVLPLAGTVVDRTGLSGVFDIVLTLYATPNPQASDNGGGRGGAQSGPPFEFDPPIATALEEQLGLHLERARVPVESLVIDHIEKATEN
jgi:uncharacterized protein (TIGR03435 family)